MPSSPTSSPTSMDTASITQLSSSIYESSTVTFIIDNEAYKTFDI
jgi:hypothetical protein